MLCTKTHFLHICCWTVDEELTVFIDKNTQKARECRPALNLPNHFIFRLFLCACVSTCSSDKESSDSGVVSEVVKKITGQYTNASLA